MLRLAPHPAKTNITAKSCFIVWFRLHFFAVHVNVYLGAKRAINEQERAIILSAHSTIKDVASEARVSVATVSRVLNQNYYVTEAVRDKVLAAVEKLEYVPNSIARSLKVNNTHTIGFVVSDISNTYHISVARSVEDVIKKQNYSMILCSTENNKERELTYLKLLLSKNIDGLILNTTGKNDKFILEMNKRVPMVLVNRRLGLSGFVGDFVDSDNYGGCYLLTKQLLSLGHRNIFVVRGPSYLSNSRERFEGFAAAMSEYGIAVDSAYPFLYEGAFTLESGMEAAAYLCEMGEPPTAVLSQNNMMTIGLLKALRSRNINVPEDISVVSYDGIDNMDLMITRPAVANFDTFEMGIYVGDAILERIGDNSIPNREFILPPNITWGNSLGVPTDNLRGKRTQPRG